MLEMTQITRAKNLVQMSRTEKTSKLSMISRVL